MVNKVTLVGRIGKDPEVRHLENENKVANFSLATTESYKNRAGERVENIEWHNIVFWGKLAEIAEKHLAKGSMIYIEGKIKTRSWDDKDGNKRYTTEIFGNTMTMLGGKPESSPESKPGSVEDDGLPF